MKPSPCSVTVRMENYLFQLVNLLQLKPVDGLELRWDYSVFRIVESKFQVMPTTTGLDSNNF